MMLKKSIMQFMPPFIAHIAAWVCMLLVKLLNNGGNINDPPAAPKTRTLSIEN